MSPPVTADSPSDYSKIWRSVYGDMQRVGPVHRHMRRHVERMLHPLTYETVLDVGCGPGYNYDLLTRDRLVTDFVGIDISSWAIESARRSVPGTFHEMDIQDKPLDRSFQMVHCSLVLEHLRDDDAAIVNMRSMTDGHLLVTTMAGNYGRYRRWEERVGHLRNYSPGELERKLSSHGFHVQQSIYWGFPFYTPIVRTLQNLSKAGTGSFSPLTRVAAHVLYFLFFFNSTRRGDLLLTLATT